MATRPIFVGRPAGHAGMTAKRGLILRGNTWKFGNNVDTDQIIPARYAIYSLDEKVLGEHAMEDVPDNEGWSKKVTKGDILVAGSNFGCGSSREIAPVAIRAAGISCVIADSFARIFFRNSINIGYPILQSAEAAEAIKQGDQLEVDLEEGVIKNLTQGDEYRADAFPEFMTELIHMGGLAPWVRKRLAEKEREKASSRG